MGGKKGSRSDDEVSDAIERASSGSTIELASGRYTLQKTLLIEKAVTIRARAVTLVAPKGQVALRVSAKQPVTLDGLRVEASTKSGIEVAGGAVTLRGCVVEGPGYDEKRDGSHGVHLKGGEHVVENGTFSGFDCGVCVDERANARVEGALANENDAGIGVTGGASATVQRVTCEKNRLGVAFYEGGKGDVSESTLLGSRGFGVFIGGDTTASVTGCLARDSELDGFHVSSGKGKAKLARNVSRNSKRHGIYVGAEFEVEVTGNVVDGCGRIGVWADKGARGRIRHNFVSRCKETGFDASGGKVLLRDNVSLRNGYAGFGFGASSESLAEFDFAQKNEQDGIYVTGSAQPTISYNELVDNHHNGILVAEKATPAVRGNYCASNDWSGLTVADKAKPVVEDNTFDGNSVNGLTACDSSQPIVRNNVSVENECDGFRLDDKTRALLEGNVARENQEDGISILAKAAPTVRNNRCIENSDAAIRIVGDGAKPKLEKNRFEDNGEDEVVRVDADDDDDEDEED